MALRLHKKPFNGLGSTQKSFSTESGRESSPSRPGNIDVPVRQINDFFCKKGKQIRILLEDQTCSSITEELANVSLRRVSRAMVDCEAERSVAAASSRLLWPPV